MLKKYRNRKFWKLQEFQWISRKELFKKNEYHLWSKLLKIQTPMK